MAVEVSHERMCGYRTEEMLSYILRFFKLLDISMIALSAFVWVLCCVRIFWRGLLICFSNAESLICARSHGYVLMCL